MAKIDNSTVALAIQSQDPLSENQSLVCHANIEHGLIRMEQDELFAYSRKFYTASIACSDNGLSLATFPRGNRADLWQGTKHLATRVISDVAGVAYSREQDSFYLSNGLGRIYRLSSGKAVSLELRSETSSSKWDNHLLAI